MNQYQDQPDPLRRPDYPPPIDDAPREPRGVVVTWLIALLACVGILSAGWIAERLVPPTTQPFPSPNPGLVMVTRVSMGMEQLGLPSSSTLNLSEFEDQLPPLDDLRTEPDSTQRTADLATYLHLAIIRAEFENEDAARHTIETIASFDSLPEPIAEDVATLHRLYIDGEDVTPLPQGFHQRNAWFADLAETYGEDPADSPARAKLLESTKSRAIALFFVVALFALAAVISLVCFVFAVVLLATGRIRAHHHVPPDEPSLVNVTALETFALFATAFAILKFLGALLENANVSDNTLAIAGLALLGAQWALLLVPLWPLLRGVKWRDYSIALGVPRIIDIPKEIAAGIGAYFALLPLVVLGFALSLFLTSLVSAQPSHPIQEEMTSGGGIVVWILLYALAVVWAPLAEEAIFRGLLYHHCRRYSGIILSACITGFLFAAIHPQGWTFIPVLMALGVNFALIRAWRATLVAAITAHAIHNAAIITMALVLLG